MRITNHNYELYFIDYHEGRLSANETNELMKFLAANPSLKNEFDEYVYEPLSPDLEIKFKHKISLKKKDTAFTLEKEEKIISFLEGDMPEDEKPGFEKEIEKDEQTKKSYAQFQATILTPDHNIEFPFKSSLKKKAVAYILYTQWMGYAAAALIIILSGISGLLLFNSDGPPERDQYVIRDLETHQINYIQNTRTATELAVRTPIAIHTLIPLRENISLARMPSGQTAVIIALPSYYNANLSLTNRINYPSYQFMDETGSLALAEAPRDKTMVGRIISGVFGRVKEPFDQGRENDADKGSKNFSLWDIANLGVKGVNALGDHDYTLVRNYDEQGKVKGLILLDE